MRLAGWAPPGLEPPTIVVGSCVPETRAPLVEPVFTPTALEAVGVMATVVADADGVRGILGKARVRTLTTQEEKVDV